MKYCKYCGKRVNRIYGDLENITCHNCYMKLDLVRYLKRLVPPKTKPEKVGDIK